MRDEAFFSLFQKGIVSLKKLSPNFAPKVL